MSESVKAYEGNDPYIYVSFCRKDQEQVLLVIGALQRKYNVWFEEHSCFGSMFAEDTLRHLESCEIFIFVITPESLMSANCRDAMRFAYELKKNIINVVIDRDTELADSFLVRYGAYQTYYCDDFLYPSELVDYLGENNVSFEKVRRSDICDETKKRSSASTDALCDDDRCADESGDKPMVIDTYRREGDRIYFGEYPQTVKSDMVNITTTKDARGYYLGSDGAYYAKAVAQPYGAYKFGTGMTIQKGATYYFKVEPVRWRMLAVGNGVALVVCDRIIARRIYDTDSNNYAKSMIRDWLNNDFYRLAFSPTQQALIEVTEVDNSVRSTNPAENAMEFNDGENEYACPNTNDKIFLLSEQEITTVAYGFSPCISYGATNTRCRQSTDYARATGAYMNTRKGLYGNGRWWLRSADYHGCGAVRHVLDDGDVGFFCQVDDSDNGVVPALRMRL